MGSGSKAEDQDAGKGVSEAGNGTSPVSLVLVGAAASFSDAFAVFAEAGAAFAGDDGLADLLEGGGY